MTKRQFCACASTLRDYALWERKLYECGIDLMFTPASLLADSFVAAMRDFNPDWAYDEKLGFDWIIEWTHTPDSPNFIQTRHDRDWYLEDAGALYDFLVFMNEHGWED